MPTTFNPSNPASGEARARRAGMLAGSLLRKVFGPWRGQGLSTRLMTVLKYLGIGLMVQLLLYGNRGLTSGLDIATLAHIVVWPLFLLFWLLRVVFWISMFVVLFGLIALAGVSLYNRQQLSSFRAACRAAVQRGVNRAHAQKAARAQAPGFETDPNS